MKPFFGENRLWWCSHCDIPLISEKCGLCGNGAEKVDLTPPMDARPAFQFDIDLVNSVCERQFGKKLLAGGLVLVNKIPSEDRALEIVAHGLVLARLFFRKAGWRINLTPAGASLMFPLERHFVKTTDGLAPFLEKGDLLVPGVVDCDPLIEPEDEVVVFSDNFVYTGIAKMSGEQMRTEKKGKAVKIRENSKKISFVLQARTWDEVVNANTAALGMLESEAVDFVRKNYGHFKKPVAVSFSGGKDSLAVLLLAEKAGIDFKVMFIDTGLEFPETISFVDDVRKTYGERFLTETAGDAFWQNLKKFGEPQRKFRWCCKVCKLGPASKIIEKNFPQGCVSLMGERRYESMDRAKRSRVDTNPWLENQLHVYPIKNWTALDVWLYIFSKKAGFNSLYRNGFDRVGCWLCPATDEGERELIRGMHPELWNKYEENIRKLEKKDLSFSLIDGVLYCRAPRQRGEIPDPQGGDSKKDAGYAGKFNGTVDVERIINLNVFGGSKGNKQVAFFDINGVRAKLFESGRFFIETGDEKLAGETSKLLGKLVLRANLCTGCGLCVSRCEARALAVVAGKARIDKEKCTRCGACFEKCPLEMKSWH